MTRREAKALVFKGIYLLLDSDNGWLDVGTEADNARMREVFDEVMAEIDRRAAKAPARAVGGVEP